MNGSGPLGVALPFGFGACVGGGMATRGVRRRPSTAEVIDASGGCTHEVIETARKELMEAIPRVMDALIAEARRGSVQHIKLVLQLMGLEEGGLASKDMRPKEKTLEEILMEQWEKEP